MQQSNIHLEGFERWLMAMYRRRGASGVIVVTTGISIIVSLLASMVSIELVSGPEGATFEEKIGYLSVAVLVPLVVAPLILSLVMRMLIKLDEALTAMARLSTTDPLTGAANRRGFFNSIGQSMMALQGSKKCLVAMVDLDSFKQLNDGHGHQVGDAALQFLAQRLEALVGDFGVVGRVGGDEFAFYRLCDENELDPMQEQLTQACQLLKLEGTPPVEFSASIGVVQLGVQEDINSALSRADAELYASKRSREPTSKREEPLWRDRVRADRGAGESPQTESLV